MAQSRPDPTGVVGGRTGRLIELDALRGIAAVSVVLNHSVSIFPFIDSDTRAEGLTVVNALKYTPLSALFAGFPAVMIFFVLSGLVLAFPFVQGRGNGYRPFIVKRILRLWPPYAAAVLLTFLLIAIIGGSDVGGLSEFFNEKWDAPITASVIGAHLSLIGSFASDPYNSALWSLVHEMRVSLVFPALFLAAVLLGWKRGLGLALLLSFVAVLLKSDTTAGNYLATLKYLPSFGAGILLAIHWKTLCAHIQNLSSRATLVLAGIALLAYSWPAWANVDWFPGPLGFAARNPASDLAVITLGASIIILLTQRLGRGRSALQSRVPQFFGRISYSLYLVHIPVLLAVITLFGATVQPVLLLPLAWAISIGLAEISQRLVERPSQNLGRRLARHPMISRPDKAVEPVARPSEPAPVLRGRG